MDARIEMVGELLQMQHYAKIDHVLDSFENVLNHKYSTDDTLTVWRSGVRVDIDDDRYLTEVKNVYDILRKRRNDLIARCGILLDDTTTTNDLFDDRRNFNMIDDIVPAILNSTTVHELQRARITRKIIELHRTYRYEDIHMTATTPISPYILERDWQVRYEPSEAEKYYTTELIRAVNYYRADLGMPDVDNDLPIEFYEREFKKMKELAAMNPNRIMVMQYARLAKAVDKVIDPSLFSNIAKLQTEMTRLIDEACLVDESSKLADDRMHNTIIDAYDDCVYHARGYLPNIEYDYDDLVKDRRAMINRMRDQYDFNIEPLLHTEYDNERKQKLVNQYRRIMPNSTKSFDGCLAFEVENEIRGVLRNVMTPYIEHANRV